MRNARVHSQAGWDRHAKSKTTIKFARDSAPPAPVDEIAAAMRHSARRAAPLLARRAQFCSSSSVYTPPPSEQRIRELQSTVAALHRAGSYEDAKTAADECYALSLSTFGAEHPASASAACNLALMHKHCGEVDAAIGLYREAHAQYEATVGATHASTATVASNLALLLRDSAAAEEGVLAEARTLLIAALDARAALHGDAHPLASVTRQHLASVLRLEGDVDGAAAMLEAAVDALEADVAGTADSHADFQRASAADDARLRLAGALNSLGLLEKERENHARAGELYEEASALREGALGPAHPDTIASRNNIAENLLAAGDEAAAQEVQRDILRRIEAEEARRTAEYVKS